MQAAPVLGPRILITGNAGAGKSTVAQQIATVLNLPLVGLDSAVWRPGWVSTPTDERRHLLREVASRPCWVVDGVSMDIARAADVVIFLDVPRLVCAWRCAKRNVRWLFTSRPGLPERCPEILVIRKLLRIIHAFPTEVRPGILALRGTRTFFHVRTGDDLRRLLTSVGG